MYTTKDDGIDLMYWEAQLNDAIVTIWRLIQALTDTEFINKQYNSWIRSAESNTEDVLKMQKELVSAGESFDETEFRKKALDGMKSAFWENINRYGSTLVNLGLVEQCSIFERAIVDTLSRVFKNRQEVFLAIVRKEHIDVDTAVELGDRTKLISHLIDRKLSTISREGIESKIKYFDKYFGISMEQVFASKVFSGDELLRDVVDYRGLLVNIFSLRNDIVHGLKRPVKDYDELSKYHHFLSKTIAQLLVQVWRKLKFKIYVLGVEMGGKQS